MRVEAGIIQRTYPRVVVNADRGDADADVFTIVEFPAKKPKKTMVEDDHVVCCRSR